MIVNHTLSRTAERTYWMARYLERAELTARLLNAHLDLVMDLAPPVEEAWEPLVRIYGSAEMFDELYGEASERSVVRFFAADQRNPGSLMSSIVYARENARTVREITPRATFEYINEIYLFAKSELSGNLSRSKRTDACTRIIEQIHQVQGSWMSMMVRSQAWEFLRMGACLERAEMTTRIVDVLAEGASSDGGLEAYDQMHWLAIQRALDTLQTYRTFVQEPVDQEHSLPFLFQNPILPRAYDYCVREISRSLRRLPRNQKPLQLCNRIVRSLENAKFEDMTADDLHEYIDKRQLELAQLSDALSQNYFEVRRLRRMPTRQRQRQGG